MAPSRRLTAALAIACGVAVANVYFPQAISPLIARSLHVSPGSAALAATAAQLGYAVGIFLLVPLGDRLPHRPLVVTLLVLTSAGLVGAGLAPGLPALLVASACVGATTVVPQILLPMAAGLTSPDRRGAVTGQLLSGLLAGILLARTFSGTLGAWWGWRTPYLAAAGLALLLAVTLAFVIPVTVSPSRQRYPALLATSVRLLRDEPELRRSCVYQALMFAGFSAAWTSLTLLITGPHYRLGTQAVGLIAFAGAASAFATPTAGRRIDRTGPDRLNQACFIVAIAAALVLMFGAFGGVAGIAAIVVGMVLLDVAVQCGQVANQSRIFALHPDLRSRLNTAYMTCVFLGGSFGSWAGVRIYGWWGWVGVSGLVAVLAAVALGRHVSRLTPTPAAASAGSSARLRSRYESQPPNMPQQPQPVVPSAAADQPE